MSEVRRGSLPLHARTAETVATMGQGEVALMTKRGRRPMTAGNR